MKITLRNDFHNTSKTLNVKDGELSRGQIKATKRALCWSTCECSGPLGIRGPQDVIIEEYDASSRVWGHSIGYMIKARH